ncbi:hypothetical protein [Roseomonas chloroacetimidivorans]|uniref:hypothetical protein n=1 Tax=Roseomonas chloroacetimidivorans TaxID=1766656 RepID=UPI003C758370
MSTTTADLTDRNLLAQIDRAREEALKFAAEQHKLAAETSKLSAEADKLRRDTRLAPWVLASAIIGGVVVSAVNIILKVAGITP